MKFVISFSFTSSINTKFQTLLAEGLKKENGLERKNTQLGEDK